MRYLLIHTKKFPYAKFFHKYLKDHVDDISTLDSDSVLALQWNWRTIVMGLAFITFLFSTKLLVCDSPTSSWNLTFWKKLALKFHVPWCFSSVRIEESETSFDCLLMMN